VTSALLCAAVLSASPIGLAEVRELSRQQNSAAYLADLNHATSVEQIRAARSVIYPQVWVTASAFESVYGPQQQYEPTPQIDANGNITGIALQVQTIPTVSQGQFNAALNLAQLLYDGGKWWNTLNQAGERETVARDQLDEQRNVSEYEGVRRFYELVRAARNMDVLQATVQRSREQLERARNLFEAGRASKGDVYTSQVNLGNDQINLARQNGAIASAQTDLAVWIARPGAEDLVAADPGTLGVAPARSPELTASLDQARRDRPLLRSLSGQVRAADLGVSIARGAYLPTVSLAGTFGRAGPSFDPTFTQPKLQNYLNLGLQMRWDVFSGFATESAVEQARIARTQADVNLSQATREVEGDVRRTLAGLAASIDVWRVSADNREFAAAALALAAERYRAGAGSQLEVQDAQLKLTQSELTKVSSRIDVEIARANVDRVLGAPSGVTP
jgi:outer membrane protein